VVPLLADENFNHRVLRGLRRRLPTIDCLPAQETEVYQHDDPDLLDWAAMHNRVVLTHDVNTMTKYAYERLAAGHTLPGVIVVPRELPIGVAIEELAILLYCSFPEEFPGRIIHLPL
jgi:hypothetical protein